MIPRIRAALSAPPAWPGARGVEAHVRVLQHVLAPMPKLRQLLRVEVQRHLGVAAVVHELLPLKAPAQVDAAMSNVVLAKNEVGLVALVRICGLE